MRRVIHVTEDLTAAGGGVTAAVMELANHLRSVGLEQEILTVAPGGKTSGSPEGVASAPLAPWGHSWRYSPSFAQLLEARTRAPDGLLHLHGIWMAPQLTAARLARRTGLPCVLSPHNMLGSWFWRDGLLRRAKKTAYWNLIGGPVFNRLPVIHALTTIEEREMRRFFPKPRIEVIPNGLDLHNVDRDLDAAGRAPVDGRYILFLARLHPVKGLELLIDAFARIPKELRCRLLIAGPAISASYLAELKRRALGLQPWVTFTGEVPARDRWAFLKHAWLVCAPSFSEGISMSALEAMASSVPVVTSHAAGLPDVPEGGGLLINPTVHELEAALIKALRWPEADRQARGTAARKLMERRYSWDVVARRYLDFYETLWTARG